MVKLACNGQPYRGRSNWRSNHTLRQYHTYWKGSSQRSWINLGKKQPEWPIFRVHWRSFLRITQPALDARLQIAGRTPIWEIWLPDVLMARRSRRVLIISSRYLEVKHRSSAVDWVVGHLAWLWFFGGSNNLCSSTCYHEVQCDRIYPH